MFDITVVLALFATISGALASVAGFGIGSILTPIYATAVGTKLAVAAVCFPHLAATALRCWGLRQHIDKKTLMNFGATSAVGGFSGAMLHAQAQSLILTVLFATLLIGVSLLTLTGYDSKLRFGKKRSGIAGLVSGLLGGMVGNQGGLRSAAMLNFDLSKESFVGTATAIGIIVDLARMPVYIVSEWRELLPLWPCITITTIAALVGTLLGMKLLNHLPQKLFKKIVAGTLLILGVVILVRGTG